jgi:hypothetical protein
MAKLNKSVYFNKIEDFEVKPLRMKDIDRFDKIARSYNSSKVWIEKMYVKNNLIYSDIYMANRKKGIYTYTLAIRRIENNKLIVNNRLEWRGMAGYVLLKEYNNEYCLTDNNFNISYEYSVDSLKEIVNNDSQLKYVGFENIGSVSDPLELISYLRVEPKIERLFKVGLGKYYKSYNRFKFDKKGFINQFLIDPENMHLVKQNTLNDILIKQRNGFNEKEFDLYKKIKYGSSFRIKFKNDKQRNIIIKYLVLMNKDYTTNINRILLDYKDYYKLMNHFNKDLSDKYWLAPKDLKKMHDKLMHDKNTEDRINEEIREVERTQRQIEKDKAKDSAFSTLQKFNKDFGIKSKNNYKIYIPTLPEMRNVAKLFNICLITNDYYIKVSQKKSLIVFIANDKQVLEVAEMSNNKILQLRGPHNQDTDYHNDILKAIEPEVTKYLSEFKKLSIEGSA